MTLEQLRIFIAVAEREHLTQASMALNMTQSAVSSALSQLEFRSGVALFDRIGRGLSLNQAGRAFLTEARKVVAQAVEAESALSDLAGLRRGALAIAASQTVGNYWMPTRLAKFRRTYPGIALDVEISNTEQVVNGILSGRRDIGVVEGVAEDPRLSITPLEGDKVVLIMPPAHPLAQKKVLSPADWASLQFVVREPGSGTRETLKHLLATRSLTLNDDNLLLTLPSNEAVCAAVEAALGVAVLSDLAVERAVDAKRVVRHSLKATARQFHLIHLKERSNSPVILAFCDACLPIA